MLKENINAEKSKIKKWDSSVLIAVIAVFISLISTFVGIKESQIMLEQQKISVEQIAASVWPYLENSEQKMFKNNSEALYEFFVENKGVGPAIIDKVEYTFNGDKIHGWSLGKALSRLYPNLMISQLQNSTLDKSVLSPGEKHLIAKIEIKKKTTDTINLSEVLNGIDFYLEYCYCSIYGKCWKVEKSIITGSAAECQIREIF